MRVEKIAKTIEVCQRLTQAERVDPLTTTALVVGTDDSSWFIYGSH